MKYSYLDDEVRDVLDNPKTFLNQTKAIRRSVLSAVEYWWAMIELVQQMDLKPKRPDEILYDVFERTCMLLVMSSKPAAIS